MRSGSNSNSLVANYSTEFEKIEAIINGAQIKKVSSSICIQYMRHSSASPTLVWLLLLLLCCIVLIADYILTYRVYRPVDYCSPTLSKLNAYRIKMDKYSNRTDF